MHDTDRDSTTQPGRFTSLHVARADQEHAETRERLARQAVTETPAARAAWWLVLTSVVIGAYAVSPPAAPGSPLE